MPEKEIHECPECGKKFGTREILEEHSRLEHGSSSILDLVPEKGVDLEDFRSQVSRLRPDSFSSFGYGFLVGLLVALLAFGGFSYYQSLDPGVPVEVTVVTCDNCSYERFRTATDRLFNTRYTEVDYRSERGQELIERYNLKYVPGFIFEPEVEEAENFTRVKSVLVRFEDAYVLPDEGNKAAQRLSSGIVLER